MAPLLARAASGPQALSGKLGAGDLVFLHDKAGRVYQLTLQEGGKLSLHSGAVSHDDLIGKPDGSLVSTHTGARLLALRPTFAERVTGRRRQAQPIYPKDLGAILMYADIHPAATVLEAGSGTGALTAALVRAVGPSGRVVSYEIREDFQQLAREAVIAALDGFPDNLEMKLGDVYEGVSESGFDRGLLDLPEPWQAIPAFAGAIVPGGLVFAHCPNVSQVARFCDGLREHGGFGLIETMEVLQRGWTVRGRSMRPDHRMVAHTGFLTFARRLAGPEVFETESF
ncbi:MAG TPA: tRNA (adenine-N1)-methyltransferase [Candidatus Dormibacteraeota bacterium]|nr:tRNA (adenine-N1)-methyltransferase [Candidatus Dormibacteraeota bacterium]